MFSFLNLIAGIGRMKKKLKIKIRRDEINDVLVRGIETLADIYQRCNVFAIEPVSYKEATTY